MSLETRRDVRTLVFGRGEIDLTAAEQIVDPGQVETIARALVVVAVRGRRTQRS